jgi:hypothetical protein
MNYIIFILLFLILFLLFSGKENFATTQDYINYLDTNIRRNKYIPAKTVSVKKYSYLNQKNNSQAAIDLVNNNLLEIDCPLATYNYIIDQGSDSTLPGTRSDATGSYDWIKYKCMKSVKDSSTDGKIQHIRNLVDTSSRAVNLKRVRTPDPNPNSTFVCPNNASPVTFSAHSVWSDPTNQYTHTTTINSKYDRDDFISCP